METVRAVKIRNIEVVTMSRRRLRIEGTFTNCETDDKFLLCKMLDDPLPQIMKIGKYLAKIYHYGQISVQMFRKTKHNQKPFKRLEMQKVQLIWTSNGANSQIFKRKNRI